MVLTSGSVVPFSNWIRKPDIFVSLAYFIVSIMGICINP